MLNKIKSLMKVWYTKVEITDAEYFLEFLLNQSCKFVIVNNRYQSKDRIKLS